jgi:indole-3-glycerol phosphate synthase
MATYLDRILEAHRAGAANDARSVAELRRRCDELPSTRGFRQALASVDSASDGVGVIAEVKRRSPSKGVLASDLDPATLARDYADGGATCLSVLTDAEFFGGSPEDLIAARSAVSLPVLRKDFTVAANDVLDARLMGADCVLLIAAALGVDELVDLHGLAREVGLDVLVEIHDETELDHAVAAGADLVGVNQRDLVTFEVDHERAIRMASVIPEGVIGVAESGVRGRTDALALAGAGYAAVLVGETLVTSGDPVAALRAMRHG